MNVVPRSRNPKRSRSAFRSRVIPRRVPRLLKYNGENKIIRTVTASIPYSSLGFTLGGSLFEAFNIVFDPSSVTFYGSAIASNSFVIPNASEITALYDRLKIDKVVMTWSSAQTNSAVSTIINNVAPKVLVANDPNDGIGGSSLVELQQMPNKSYYDGDGTAKKWTCYPKYQRVVYQSAAVSNYEPATGFVNSNSTIPHYGIKLAIANLSNISTTALGRIDFDFKLFLSLKNVK